MRHINDTRLPAREARIAMSVMVGALASIGGAAFAQDAPAGPSAPPPPAEKAPGESAPAESELLEAALGLDEYEYSPGENPEAPLEEIDEAAGARTGMFSVPGLTPLIESWRQGLDELHSKTGFRFALAYTTLLQQTTNGGKDSTGFSGDLDLMTDWTLIGRGTANTGRLIATFEYRHQIHFQPPSFIGDDVGSLQRTTGGFNDRGWAVRDVHYTQRLFDGRLRLLVGRADSSDYVGGHRLQSINNSFSNRTFSADSTTAYPSGHVMTLGASIRPIDQFYATFGGANAYGTSTTSDLSELDEGKFFTFGEAGFTPTIPDLGWGRYAVLVWHMDDRPNLSLPSDYGFTVIAEQDFGKRMLVFARYGWADTGDLTGIKQSAQIGMGYRGLFGDPLNMTGAAFGVSDPAASNLDPESVFEVFQRFQLTSHTQFSVGFQAIFEPSRSDDDFNGVFTFRFRLAF